MAWKFRDGKSGQIFQLEEQYDEQSGRDLARDKAISKGHVPVIEMVDPKDGSAFFLDDRQADKAVAKGYKTKEKHDNEMNVAADRAERQRAQFEDGAKGKALSAVKGFADTATYGFSDEIAGAYEGLARRGENEDFIDAYRRGRDADRSLSKEGFEVNPKSSMAGMAAAVVPTLFASGANPNLARIAAQGATEGAVMGAGNSEADLTRGEIGDFAGDIGKSAALTTGLGMGGELVGRGVGKMFGRRAASEAAEEAGQFIDEAAEESGLRLVAGDSAGVAEPVSKNLRPVMKEAQSPEEVSSFVSNWLRNKAEKLAENATGATGNQSDKFADNAGRELLDRGIVGFGDNAESIARKSGNEMDRSGGEISAALKGLDAKGATISRDELLSRLDSKIGEIGKNESQGQLLRQLKTIREDLLSSPSVRQLSDVEEVKRGFQKKGNYDTDVMDAKKAAASVYQEAVEDKALAMDPGLASDFIKNKKEYGLMSPIEEAAAKRARTLKQSPLGGLLDTAAFGTAAGGVALGASGGDPMSALTTGVAGAALRRQIMPRAASSAAVTLDRSANYLDKISSKMNRLPPKYQTTLRNATQRGGNAVAVTHFLLGNQDPEYRKHMETDDE